MHQREGDVQIISR